LRHKIKMFAWLRIISNPGSHLGLTFMLYQNVVSVTGGYKREMRCKNSVALVRERTIPTERPPPVGEVSANFCG
jgi:hypothetical protein